MKNYWTSILLKFSNKNQPPKNDNLLSNNSWENWNHLVRAIHFPNDKKLEFDTRKKNKLFSG